jgi:hypothetical protein
MQSTEEVASRYVASVVARDIDSYMALLADDAIMTFPDGRSLSGATAIREERLRVFESGVSPSPTVAAVVAGVNAIAVELEVRLNDGTVMHTANLYYLNSDGRIQRLNCYRQGP